MTPSRSNDDLWWRKALKPEIRNNLQRAKYSGMPEFLQEIKITNDTPKLRVSLDLSDKHAGLSPDMSQRFKKATTALAAAFSNPHVGNFGPFVIAKTRDEPHLLSGDRLHSFRCVYPMFVPCDPQKKTRAPFAGPQMGHTHAHTVEA